MFNSNKYLLDSNTIIDYLEGKLPSTALNKLDRIVDQKAKISVITQIEILGWKDASPEQLKLPSEFVDDAIVLELTSDVVNKTIRIRQQCKIKLPDAIIAASALVHDLTLLTRNIDDFKNIDGLTKIDPYTL